MAKKHFNEIERAWESKLLPSCSRPNTLVLREFVREMRPTGTSRIEVLRILGGSWKQRWTAGLAMCLGFQSRSSKQMTDGVCHGTHWQDGYGMKHMVLEDTCMFEGQRLSVRLREKAKACINQGRSRTKRGGTWLRQVVFSP